MSEPPAELTLELRRVLPAPAPAVFHALTSPGELAQWWGPAGFTIPNVHFDVRPGERYRFEMQPPEGPSFHLTGEVREADPPRHLSYTFRWEDPDPDDIENLVEVTLDERGGATEVVVVQGPFKTPARHELHRDGWSDSLDKLHDLLTRA